MSTTSQVSDAIDRQYQVYLTRTGKVDSTKLRISYYKNLLFGIDDLADSKIWYVVYKKLTAQRIKKFLTRK